MTLLRKKNEMKMNGKWIECQLFINIVGPYLLDFDENRNKSKEKLKKKYKNRGGVEVRN